jgi:hypothetical protein
MAGIRSIRFDGEKVVKLRWHANKPGEDERPKDFEKATHALMVFERVKK